MKTQLRSSIPFFGSSKIARAVLTGVFAIGMSVVGLSSASAEPVTAIVVSGADNATTITVDGGTLQMSAAVTPDNATDAAVVWSVANGSGTATIDQQGVLTATGNGTVTVTATAQDGSGVSDDLEITISNQAVADNADIATARATIEAATYTSTQGDAATSGAALTKAQALVDALAAAGTTRVVVAGVFTGAVAGTAGTPAGTDGSYTFTVTINKGVGTEAISATQTMAITATAYVAPAPAPVVVSSPGYSAAEAAAIRAANEAAAKVEAEKIAAAKAVADAKAAAEAEAKAAADKAALEKAAAERAAADKIAAEERAVVEAAVKAEEAKVAAAAAKAAASEVKVISSKSGTKLTLDLADKYFGKIVTVYIGTKKNGKVTYRALDFFAVDKEDGTASISTKVKLTKGQIIRVNVGKTVVKTLTLQ